MSKRTSRSSADLKTSPWVIAGIVAIALLVVAVLVQFGQRNAPMTVATPPPDAVAAGLTADGHHYRGSLEAKVVLIEFEDLRCPFCQRYFLQTEPSVIEQYVKAGLVRTESRIIPLLGPASVPIAEAVACAGEQGKYWEFRHVAFTNQAPENNPDGRARFLEFAQAAGVSDMAAFTNCFDTQRYKAQVGQAMNAAQSAGIQVTPTLIVNGVKYEGALSFEAGSDGPGLKDVLDQALVVAGGG